MGLGEGRTKVPARKWSLVATCKWMAQARHRPDALLEPVVSSLDSAIDLAFDSGGCCRRHGRVLVAAPKRPDRFRLSCPRVQARSIRGLMHESSRSVPVTSTSARWMSAPALAWGTRRTRSRPNAIALRRPGERLIVAGLAWVAYVAAAAIVVVGAHSIIGDAWSRVANGYYVLFSRDPHLAAIGFVWKPLPSLAVIPLLPLKILWPDMVATGFAGSIISALCMAAAVWELHGIALDWHVRRSARIVATLLFAFNPMIVYYGANGMSEAMFILTLVVAIRYLARWVANPETVSLVVAAFALAAAYMTRYEAVVAALGAFGMVVVLSAWRRTGRPGSRIWEGVADGAVLAVPFATVFVAWAVASWLIVGDPFQQFTSVYGVVSQLAVAQPSVAQSTGQGTSAAYLWIAKQILGLEPGLLVLGLLGLAATFRGRHGLTLPAVAILGGVVAFAIFGFLTGRTLGWLRYSITVIPLASILAFAVLAPNPARTAESGWRAFRAKAAGQAAAFVDGLNLRNGSVLVDGAMGFPIILESRNPTQFVTTPDRDFQLALLDPISFHVKYLLVPENVGYQSLDAINRAYPGIYASGAGIGQLVKQFSAGGNNWRLYEVSQ